MGKVLIEESTLTAIGDSIRGKTGKTAKIPPLNMPSEISDIQTTPDAVEQATPSISVSSAGLITASATQTEGYVVAGTKEATKQLSTQAAKTITPGTSDQTAVAKGRYTTGAITVKGDANLIAANILKGVSIFGVEGSVVAGRPFQAGSFTPEEDVTEMTISHSLGVAPRIALYFPTNGPESIPNTAGFGFYYPDGNYNYAWYHTGGGGLGKGGYGTAVTNASTTSIKFGVTKASEPFSAGYEYSYILVG